MDRHEIEVLRQAKMYQRMGYIVKADINEWERPHLINNHRPDVIAILPYNQGARYEVVIVEVDRGIDAEATKQTGIAGWLQFVGE